MKIVVRAPNWIGDQILAYPFYYYLRRSYPNAHIVSVCVDWVRDLQFRTLVDELFVLPRPLTKGLFARFAALNESAGHFADQHGRDFDLGISLPNSFSAAWFLKKAGVRTRRGYRTEARGFILNDGIKWNSDPSCHRSQAYVNLLAKELKADPQFQNVRWFWGNSADGAEAESGVLDLFPAEKEWGHVQAHEPPQEPYWVMAPGATAVSRRWNEGNFVQLARLIHQNLGLKGLIVGGPKEAPLIAAIAEDPDAGLVDFSARGSVASLWKIFRNARFSVTNESGLAHVASLCGSRVQIVCGAADPRRTRPIGPGAVTVRVNPVDCWPCERNLCYQREDKQLQCLRGIHPDSLWEEMQSGGFGS